MNYRKIDYKLYKIDKCPKHEIWRSTASILSNPVFLAAVKEKDLPISGGGVLDQPVNFSDFAFRARNELDAFFRLVAERDRK